MKQRILISVIFAGIFFTACKKEELLKTTQLYVEVQKPKLLEDKNVTLEEMHLVFRNVNTGNTLEKEIKDWSISDICLEEGFYNVEVTGTVKYVKIETGGVSEGQSKEISKSIKGVSENLIVKGENLSVSIATFVFNAESGQGFVLSEIYFSGSLTPEGKQFDHDKFFEIYNNSNQTLYADGLCIAETELRTVQSLNKYEVDIRNEAVPVITVYRIPGEGKDYPVLPGKTIVLCDIPVNHQAEIPTAIDLSQADFEWYDKGSIWPDPDIPEVPNMEKVATMSESIWSMNNIGYTSYILFRPPMQLTPEEFTANYAYHYKWFFEHASMQIWMEEDAWKVPNEWVVDAVQLSTPSDFEWTILDPSLDISWTHSGDNNDERHNHSVKRKVSHKEGNRIVLQDTNDSAFDFIATAANPSPGTVEDHQ